MDERREPRIHTRTSNEMNVRRRVNDALDRMTTPTVTIGARRWASFHVCGVVGLVAAVALGAAVTAHRGLPLWVLGVATLTAVAAFLGLAMATKLLLGYERLVYYHNKIAILLVVSAMLWMLGQPMLPFLDATALGVGAFFFFGRVGCFLVGCCHGRPHAWGVRYRTAHADHGFTPCFVGARLFPIQLVEAGWVLAAVIGGTILVVLPAAPGAALAWYLVVYGLGRFSFEFLRGDIRPTWGGFSEPQWTSVGLIAAVVGAEATGILPSSAWHLLATAGLALTMATVALKRGQRSDRRRQLTSVTHVRELAEAAERLASAEQAAGLARSPADRPVEVATTSAGIRLSAGTVQTTAGAELRHYSFSSAHAPLSRPGARDIARLLHLVRHPDQEQRLVSGLSGVFHLLVQRGTGRQRPWGESETYGFTPSLLRVT